MATKGRAVGRSKPVKTAPPSPPRSVGPAAGRLDRDLLALQAAAGNRATTELLRTRSIETPALQRDNLGSSGSGYKVGGREQVELAWVLKEYKTGVKISFKVTASRKGSKVLESPTAKPAVGGEATWSLGENKAALEKAAGKWGVKLSSALARTDWSGQLIPDFPALRVRVTGKGAEGKFDLAKGQADLDLLSIALAIDGDAVELLDWAGLAHLKDRVSVKATIEAKRGLSVADAARIKSALTAKDEVAAAAKEAEKHADDFAKHKRELDALKAEEKRLARRVAAEKRAVAQAQKTLDRVKGTDLRFSHHQQRLRQAEATLKNAQGALANTEKRLVRQKATKKAAAGALKRAGTGLAEAGRKLARAGHKLDGALKNVNSKLGAIAKKQLDKATKAIMKKLGKTLLAKGLMKLIPGLNILSTVWDIGNLLWDVFGSKKSDKPGGGGGGDGSDGDDGSGGAGGSGDQGGQGADAGGDTTADPGAADAGSGTGSGTAPGTGTTAGSGTPGGGPTTKVLLSDRAKQLVEAFAGPSVALDDTAVAEINAGIPADITAAELPQLIERLRGKGAGELSNPYELTAEIQAELADLRAGKPTIEFDGRPAEEVRDGATTMEPPKTLFPGTRQDIKDVLVYDTKSDRLTLKPEFEKAYRSIPFRHPDGLGVDLTAVDVTSRRPRGEADTVMVTVVMKFAVRSLPDNPPAGYPYTKTSTEEVKMTFLYAPKRKEWGEMDYSHVAQLRSLLTRTGSRWTLTGAGKTVDFEHASVKVTQLVGSRVVPGANGAKVHQFVLEVIPVTITGSQAGYTTSDGWVLFKRGVPARIGFELPD